MNKVMVDVSDNNPHPIAWEELKSLGVDAVMIKATEGISYVNPYLQSDATAAHGAGLLVGYYHYGRPGQKRSVAEAVWMHHNIDKLPRSLGVALDLEVIEGRSWKQLSNYALNFFHQFPGVRLKMLYTTPTWAEHLQLPTNVKWWLADWTNIRPNMACAAWQYTNNFHALHIDASHLYL